MALTYEQYLQAAQAYEAKGDADNARRMLLAAEQTKANGPQKSPLERAGSLFFDIGQGVGAGIVDVAQGPSQLGAAAIDLAADTSTRKPVTEVFEGTKEKLGLTPETTPGVIAEELTNLGIGYIATSAGLGFLAGGPMGAGAGAVGGAAIAAARALRGGSTVQKLVQASRAQKAMAARAAIVARTAGTAGLAEVLFSPEGRPTVSDSFDALPNILKTEELLNEAGGRLAAAKAFRNRLRYGAEATAGTALFDTSLQLFGAGARATGSLPYVGAATSKVSRGIVAAFEAGGRAMNTLPGGPSVKQFYQRKLTASRGLAKEAFEAKQDALSVGKTASDEATLAFAQFDKAARQAVVAQAGARGFFSRPALKAKAYNDLTAYLEGANTVLNDYPVAVKKAADRLRELTYNSESAILDELQAQADSLLPGARRTGVENKISEIEHARQQRNAYRNLAGPRAQQFGHLARVYQLHEQPVAFWKGFKWDAPLVREVTDEFKTQLLKEGSSLKGGALELAAKTRLEDALKVEAQFIGQGIHWKELSKLMVKATKERRKTRTTLLPGVRPDMPLDTSSLIPRVNLSINLQKLMGQVRDPKQLMVRTMQRNATLAAHNRFYRTTADGAARFEDLDGLLASGQRPLVVDFDYQMNPRAEDLLAAKGYRKLPGEVDYPMRPMPGEKVTPSALLGGEYGPLSGKWVADELYDSLTVSNRLGNSVFTEAGAMGVWAKAFSQQMTVVQSPLSHIRNFLGNFMFLGANANITRDMHVLDHIQLFSRSLAKLSDEGLQRKIRELSELGLVDNALATSQIKALKQMSSDLTKSESLEHFFTNQLVDKIPLMRWLNERYASVDSMFKSMAFSAEESKLVTALSKSGLDLADPEIEGLVGKSLLDSGLIKRLESKNNPDFSWVTLAAADVVKDTMPNYPRVGELVRGLDATPFFGAFTSFASESIRNSVNTVTHGLKQMAFQVPESTRAALVRKLGSREAADAAANALEREIRAQGANRVANYVAVSAIGPAQVAKASQRAAGMSDEEFDEFTTLTPPFLSGHALQVISFKPGEKIEYIDQSYVNPYGFAQDAARAGLRAYSQQGRLNASEAKQIGAGLWESVSSFAEPFLGESLVFERVMDVLPQARAGRTKIGAEVYKSEGEGLGDKIGKSIQHVLAGFIPGFAREFATVKGGKFTYGRLSRAMLDAAGQELPDTSGKTYTLAGEFARVATGFTPMEVNLAKDFYYSGEAYKPARSESKALANKLLKDESASVPQMVTQWNKYLDTLYQAQSKLYADVEAARKLGMSDQAIRRQLVQKANLGKAEVARIMRGEFTPTPVSKDVRKDIRRDIRAGWPRRETDIPWALFNSLTAQRRGQKLNPRILKEQREAEAAAKAAAEQPAQPTVQQPQPQPLPQPTPQSAPPPLAPTAAAPPSPPSQVQGQAQPQPQPQPPAARAVQQAAIDPKILGNNPLLDQGPNRELAERLARRQTGFG